MSIKSIFISKDAEAIKDLVSYASQHRISLCARSFLSFEPVPYNVQEPYQVVFFGSKNAVHYFLKQKPDLLGAKIAAVGESTARTLEEYGIKASFIGKGSDIPTIGREFRSWCNGQRVLFPQSDLSLQSISILFPEDQKEDVVVYKTIIETHSVPESDVYVFTSPSNIDGFLLSNSLPKGSTVIAWGNSTKRALREKGIQAVQISDPTVGSLIEKLKEL